MHTNVFSFALLGLAALSTASPHRLVAPGAINAPLNHRRMVHHRHEALHQRRPAVGAPLVARADGIRALQSELTTFTSWMSTFLASANATNTPAAIAQVKDEVTTHAAAVTAFIAAASVDASSLSQLQSELTVFQGWADAWCAGAPAMSSAAAVAQLRTEVQSYEGWLAAWLANVSGGAPAPVAAPPPAVTLSTSTIVVPTPSPEPVPQAPAAPQPNPQSEHSSSSQVPVETPAPKVPAYQPPPVAPEPSSMTSATPVPSAQPYTPPTSGSGPSGGSDSGSGETSPKPNAGGAHGLAAWWGQTAAASSEGLASVCADDAFDTVIISFLTTYFGPGGYPTLNLGPAPASCSAKQTAAGAHGLVDGSSLVPAIKTCQGNGKRVMLSLGGALASGSAHSGTGAPTSVFSGDAQGKEFAQTLWDLFLGGQSPLRPFGDVKLDGIDMDSEAGDGTGYGAFASALRGKFSLDASKSYYLSAAPQCPMPDASIPIEALHQCDFVWTQFYNNGNCNHGQGASFMDSVQGWSKNLAGSDAKLYVAAIASTNQGSGYIDADALAAEAAEVKKMGLSNFGGYALWDASLAMQAGGMHTKLKAALSS